MIELTGTELAAIITAVGGSGFVSKFGWDLLRKSRDSNGNGKHSHLNDMETRAKERTASIVSTITEAQKAETLQRAEVLTILREQTSILVRIDTKLGMRGS